MQLPVTANTNTPEARGRRLAKALRIEAYFRGLNAVNPTGEVLSQWQASRQLVARALQDRAVLDLPSPPTHLNAAG